MTSFRLLPVFRIRLVSLGFVLLFYYLCGSLNKGREVGAESVLKVAKMHDWAERKLTDTGTLVPL